MAMNLATSHIVVPVDAGDSSIASYQTLTGMNGASCQCGIGINTGSKNPKPMDWTVIDQFTQAREPQKTQFIGWGGDSVVTGQEDADLPSLMAVDYENADFNDLMYMVTASQAANPGDSMHPSTGTVNRTGTPVASNDWLWGTVPVA